MSGSETHEPYMGYNELVSYLRERKSKRSFRGFLIRYREVIVTSTLPSVSSSWWELNRSWSSHFMTEAKNLEQEQKVCSFFILRREGNSWSIAFLNQENYSTLIAGNHPSFYCTGALTLSLVKVY